MFHSIFPLCFLYLPLIPTVLSLMLAMSETLHIAASESTPVAHHSLKKGRGSKSSFTWIQHQGLTCNGSCISYCRCHASPATHWRRCKELMVPKSQKGREKEIQSIWLSILPPHLTLTFTPLQPNPAMVILGCWPCATKLIGTSQ